MSRRKNGTGISVGSSSVLVIFVVLCLTAFATLSLVSAKADYKLTQKATQATTEYYMADAQAEEYLQILHKALQSTGMTDNLLTEEKLLDVQVTCVSKEDYLKRTNKPMKNPQNNFVLSYDVPINERKNLHVEFGIALDANGMSQSSPERLCWQVQPILEQQNQIETNLAGISNLPNL